MKKTRYKIAWFKIDFKRSLDDKLMVLDIGGGQSSSMNGFDQAKVRASFCHTVTKFAKTLYISSVFQNLFYQRIIQKDFIDPACSARVVSKSHDELRSMTTEGGITQDDVILFNDELKTPEIYAAYYQDFYSLPVISGEGIFHILYRDKNVLYQLQTLFHAQSDYWHYPIKMSDFDLEKIKHELPDSEHGYYLKPTNLDIAKGIQIFATKNELISVLEQRDEKNQTIKGGNQQETFNKTGHLASQSERLETIKKINAMRLFQTSSSQDDSIDHYDIQPKILGKSCEHQGQNWDPTGRAFVTLVYDTESNSLHSIVNGCSWILPKEALSNTATATSSSLANLSNSSQFIEASDEECNWLQKSFQAHYSDLFIACFTESSATLLDRLKTADKKFESYYEEQILCNSRYYVGKNPVKHLKQNLSTHAEERISMFLGIARAMTEEGKLDEAMESANAAKILYAYVLNKNGVNKWDVTITNVIASIYFKSGQLEVALSLYKEALIAKPGNQILLDSIANIEHLISTGEVDNTLTLISSVNQSKC